MSNFRQVLLGMFAALFSSALVFGSLALALAEGGLSLALAPTATFTSGPTPTIVTPLPGEPTFTPSPSPLPSATPTPATPGCTQPSGWKTIDFLPGDTLAGIASQFGITLEELKQANCLVSEQLNGGVYLYVPAVAPSPTFTSPPPTAPPAPPTRAARVCTQPAGWRIYIVRSGDNLYQIGLTFGVSVPQLKAANCLASDKIITGQRLYVPNVPTRTPVFSPTSPPSPTTGVSSPTPRPSATPTNRPISSPTPTKTPVTPPPTPTAQTEPTRTAAPTQPNEPPTATQIPPPVSQPTPTPPDGP